MTGPRENKLEELGFPLDKVPAPAAIYKHVVIDGDTLYSSGAIPVTDGAVVFKGKVPGEVPLEKAQDAARLCAANILRCVRRELGSLDKIVRLVRATGYVNSDPLFTDQHLVMNGASQFFKDVLGEDAGMGARSAVGVATLPLGCAVEVEAIFKIRA